MNFDTLGFVMTEQEWQNTTDALAMVKHLRGPPRQRPSRWFGWMGVQSARLSERKARLFASACLRRIGEMSNRWFRRAVQLLEKFAETGCSEGEIREARSLFLDRGALGRLAADLLDAGRDPGEALLVWVSEPEVRPFASELLREIYPYRALERDAAWLEGHRGQAGRMLAAIVDQQGYQDLPILADALEENGCDMAELLDHLRGPDQHVLGCWALDVLRGRD